MQKLDISTLLASTIHESKNQIGSLIYQIEVLKRKNFDNDTEAVLNKIQENMKQLNDEWVEYLYLYRLATDGYQVHYECHSLAEFLDDQVFALTPSANSKNIELSFNIEDDFIATFDDRLMTAVVSTAFYNALRFASSKIEINAHLENNFLIINIEDDGIGFDNSRKLESYAEKSTGLGLYFAELSANAHNVEQRSGFIKCLRSSSLNGAKLSIFIPQ